MMDRTRPRSSRSPRLIPLPDLRITEAAEEVLDIEEILAGLSQMAKLDWGEVGEPVARANDRAAREGGRLVALYSTACGVRFSMTLEADRSSLSICLAAEP